MIENKKKYIWILLLLLILFISLILVVRKTKHSKIDNYENINGDFIVICGCVYQCEPYLKSVLTNMEKIGTTFKDYIILIAIDKGKDNSLKILEKWQKKNPKLKILTGQRESEIRTQNICNARNRLLQEMRNIMKTRPFEYFLMMDCDSVSSSPVQLDTLKEVLDNKNLWDSVSFTTQMNYYDIWALNYDDFYISYCHTDGENEVFHIVKNDIHQKIAENIWYRVYSAFNGSALYKTNMFLDLDYRWKIEDNMRFIDDNMLERHNNFVETTYPRTFERIDDCEHRFFHFQAYFIRGAKIYIYSKPLFPFNGTH